MVTHVEPWKVGTNELSLDQIATPFKYNPIFEVIAGKKFMQKNGDCHFTKMEEQRQEHKEYHTCPTDGSYRTVFGPCIPCNTLVLANSAHNIAYGLRRMTAFRFPLEPGKDGLAEKQHNDWFAREKKFIGLLKKQWESDTRDYNDWMDALDKHIKDLHPKRALRLQARKEAEEAGYLNFPCEFVSQNGRVRGILYKGKKYEFAKFGKYMRMIGDLGVLCSLVGFVSTGMLKHQMCRAPFRHANGDVHTVKNVNLFNMEAMFNDIETSTKSSFYCFSDDGLLHVYKDGKHHWFNVDIKTCDASHYDGIFDALLGLTDELPDCARLLDEQCRQPFYLVNPSNRREKLVLKCKRRRLFSGSTITTIINNLANNCLGKQYMEDLPTTAAEVKASAWKLGYVVTVEECQYIQQTQFLKHSPARDSTGKLVPVLNLGCYLRSMGMCKGDLPGKGPIGDKIEIFNASYLNGCYPRTHTPFLTNQRKAFGKTLDLKVVEESRKSVDATKYPDVYLTSEEFFARYTLGQTGLSFGTLVDVFSHCSSKTCYFDDLVARIMDLDYGLKMREEFR